ncbi:hypothetical protein CBS9595_002648 [Malassezia furfur]|nr:hypothetical protein CBS9595_002648 [Malassezia furfur]
MARRKARWLAEGSDSNDSVHSSDDDAANGEDEGQARAPRARAAPSFVRASKPPAFVAAGHASRTDAPADAPADAPVETEAESEAASESEDDTLSFARRSIGAGLGAKLAQARGQTSNDARAEQPAPARPPPPPAPAPPPSVPLSRVSGSGGLDPSAYLRQMGWTGGGLGKEGEGIVNPIEVQLRPTRAGVAFGGLREKTKQARAEERRRTGAPASSDEEDDQASTQRAPTISSSAWRRKAKERKPTVVYRTYEEIIAEAAAPGVGPVLDATGHEVREVDSLAAALAKHAVPTSESAQLPELRHNLRLLSDGSRDALQKLAREGAAHLDRARWLDRDLHESARRAAKIDEERAVLRSVLDTVMRLSEAAQVAERLEDLAPFVEALLAAQAQSPRAAQLGLDEAVAGALVPVLRRVLVDWDPLEAPHAFTATLAPWRAALQPASRAEGVMTPYESVLWNVWMPKIRSTLTGAWDVYDPASAIALVEAWRDLLPPFLYDNVLEQLVLPKLHRAVRHWSPKERVPLHVLLLPWVPVGGRRMDTLLADARQQWRSALAAWRVADGVPPELMHWKAVFPAKDWDALLLDKVVPALGKALRTEFVVNPADQVLATLDQVLAWRTVLRESVLSRLLEVEFGTPFLRTLHTWLVQPTLRFDEVAGWYTFWRNYFPPEVMRLAGIASVMMRALRLMNRALDLGEHRETLPVPDVQPTSRSEARAAAATADARRPAMAPPPVLEDVAFRAIVEDEARQRDLFVLPQNKLEPTTGLALLRVAQHIDGKRGVSFYLDDDVVFAATDAGEYEPTSVAALLARASAST